MDSRFDAFLDNLKQNTPASPRTSQVYLRDVAALDAFLGLEKDGDYETVTQKQLEEYFSELKRRGRSDATLARVLCPGIMLFSWPGGSWRKICPGVWQWSGTKGTCPLSSPWSRCGICWHPPRGSPLPPGGIGPSSMFSMLLV